MKRKLWILASSLFLSASTLGSEPLLDEIGIDPRLDGKVSSDLIFRDEGGSALRLGALLGERPLVLALVYYRCPMLCTEVLDGLVRALRALSLDAGSDFELVVVSFDPSEGPPLAAKERDRFLREYGREKASSGIRFLTGSPESIDALTRAVGFRYVRDDDSPQFAHASALVVLTPEGRISRYFYGIEYAPRDLGFALIEAAAGRVGSPLDQILLYCYQYDPETGRYGLVIMRVLRLAGLATLLALGAFVGTALRRDRKGSRSP